MGWLLMGIGTVGVGGLIWAMIAERSKNRETDERNKLQADERTADAWATKLDQ